MSRDLPLPIAPLPPAPPFRKLIGPSFILLGLGLGSGEVILWPYLTSNYGLGLVWGILIGVTIQFFINMEVERYALINGESVFVGFARWLRFLPLWFIFSTFAGFGWPGIGLASATLLSNIISTTNIQLTAIFLFIGIGLILTLGKQLYTTVETLEKYLFAIGTPLIFILAFYLSNSADWQALLAGLVGQGKGFTFFPATISFSSFLAAVAFSGAGGNLNLAQSFYIRDKGYGMGKYSHQIGSLLRNPNEVKDIQLTGSTFAINRQNLSIFHRWWKAINLEHFLIFWLLGLATMLTLSLLAYVTAFGHPNNPEGINFLLVESSYIAQRTLPFVGTLFLLVTGLMLAATQLTVLDSTSRIITENVLLAKNITHANVSRIYYTILWFQIIFGISIFLFGFTQPRQLITISAQINAATMFVYIFLLLYLNNRHLHPSLRPSPIRNLILLASGLFFGLLIAANFISH